MDRTWTFKVIRALAISLALLMLPRLASATTTLQVNGSGILTGASGVNVGGTLYDVSFVDGTCTGVFGVCDYTHFDFTTSAAASLAAQALLDQVFLDVPQGAFDSNLALTNGCTTALLCTALIPYTLHQDGTVTEVDYEAAYNWNLEIDDSVSHVQWPQTLFNSTDYASITFARFTPTTTPLPAALPLFASGLGALGLFGWRRKRKAQAAA